MATEETVSEIIKLVADITERDVADVVRNSKWGEYNFDDCRNDLEAAYSVIRPILELPLESILQGTATDFQTRLGGLRDAINNVTEFSVKEDTPANKRDVLAAALNKHSQSTWQLIAPCRLRMLIRRYALPN